MAKENETRTETSEAKNEATPTIEKPYDPMKDLVAVNLPKATGREENFVFVALNGKGYQIMRGVTVRVPRPVAYILWESQRQEERQAAFMEAQRQAAERAFGTNAL